MPKRSTAVRETRSTKRKTSSATAVKAPPPSPAAFPIVGIGASAGGLEPFLQMLRELGDAPGMAIIYVLHQEKHHDVLAGIVARATKMPVVRGDHSSVIESNHVYVGSSDFVVTFAGGQLETRPRTEERELPIDILFRSLAEYAGNRAIAVVLSGTASDGALGTKAVKAEGGITFAQDDSAKFAQMPHAAISAGSIDHVLPPLEIAQELVRLAGHVGASTDLLPGDDLAAVFRLLHAAHDVDFTHYKPSTVERRIRRRMALHKIDALSEYVSVLRDDPAEIEQLYGDILIRVTEFFRDPQVYDALRRDIFPALVRGRKSDKPLRIWVPGCSTGEEVYSLAITLLETAQEVGLACPLQIFGTDVSDAAVDHARNGLYPENISAEVSPDRLRRFFTKGDNGGYRVAKAVRDLCVFARQNLTRDPPFSNLDLISCRNVMIYLGAVLQRRVLSIFHYALRTNGFLLLGSAETVGNHGDLFAMVDRKNKIYQKKKTPTRSTDGFEPAEHRERVERIRTEEDVMPAANVLREADRVILSRFSPPGVVIDENMEVVQFRGRTSLFLEPPSGAASFNLLKMAREGLLADLRAAVHAARKQEAPVRREAVRVKTNGDAILVNIEVVPFATTSRERYQIVLFEQVPETKTAEAKEKKPGRKSAADPEPDTRPTARLKRELEATREYLQSIIEEQEAMNEELRSANEEIQSSNEELQSTNEELETAKEELQSTNEELTTLNEELENRNEELAQVNNDLINLLGAVDLPIVMLDGELRIRRFNPGAQRALNLIPTDVGRSINDLKTTLVLEDLDRMILSVIDTLEMKELEVQDRAGQWYTMRIRPYKTTDNRIDGAVIVLIDIKKRARAG